MQPTMVTCWLADGCFARGTLPSLHIMQLQKVTVPAYDVVSEGALVDVIPRLIHVEDHVLFMVNIMHYSC